MSIGYKESLVIRKSFGKIDDIIPLPNLIEVQSNSFNEFVQLDFLPQERSSVGMEKVFRDIFPINYNDRMSLEYIGYELGDWSCICGKVSGINERYAWVCSSCDYQSASRLKENCICTNCSKKTARYSTCADCLSRVKIKVPLSVEDCRSGNQTFSLPLKVKLQLISWEENIDKESKEKIVRDVKEQEIFFFDIPVMSDIYEDQSGFRLGSLATFIVNGVNRVVVSQIHRSPGVVFGLNKKNKDSLSTSRSYIARIIPNRGSWIDFESDNKDILYVKIDKTRKIIVTTFLQALGFKRDEITKLFYNSDHVLIKNNKIVQRLDSSCVGIRIEKGMLSKDIEDVFIGKKLTLELVKKLQKAGIDELILKKSHISNRVIAQDILDSATGEIFSTAGEFFSDELYEKIIGINNLSVYLIASSGYVLTPIIPLTLAHDKCFSKVDAVREIYHKVFPGDNAPFEEMEERINDMFFNPKMYDLTKVGRIKINRKLNIVIPESNLALTKEDIVSTIRYLVNLREREEGSIDDIDHLGNRRIRLVGELLANQMYSGMLRVDRIARERYRMYDNNKSLTPYDLINIKPLAGIVREFFATGQLSQFMDQTNPLAEIAHKRRLSSLGPGGVIKERATYEIRDVHTSHYGRICPIETPEGQAIGLISSLATFAYVNDLGFIETPYRQVIDGEVQDDIVYLDAFEESNLYIAQAEILKKNNKKITGDSVLARYKEDFVYVSADKIQYVDLSPKQLVSVATALIPFLEHDDAVRALMGSNMQRQAVPLIQSDNPLIGTGMEKNIAEAAVACLVAKHSGFVEYVSGEKIVVRANESEFYNIEDYVGNGIDVYHLRKFEGSSYDTCINQTPIVKIGQSIKKGQLLTNASSIIDGELSLGRNLLVAFMPWRGYNYEDAIVLNKRLVSESMLSSIQIEEYTVDARDTRLGPEEITSDIPNISNVDLEYLDEDGIIKIGTRVKAGDILVGKVTLKGDIQNSPEEKLLRAIFGEKSREVRDSSLRMPAGSFGVVIDVKVFSRSGSRKDIRYKEYVAEESKKLIHELDIHKRILNDITQEKIAFAKTKKDIDYINSTMLKQYKVLDGLLQEKLNILKRGDPLPSGVIKMVKVYVASMRHVQVGDKLSGRHGNKGVVSLILPREDMPYMEDGSPVDVIVNPLGVPSRMNIGQILETILGFCGVKIGEKYKKLLEEQSRDAIRREITQIFGESFVKSLVEQSGEDKIYDLAKYISQKGMHFAVPVFDSGSFEQDIKPIVENLNLSVSGSYKLRDGRSGDLFDQKITVGIMYIMKLNHMVDDKLHARSVGPYSLVTQQPLGGKAQMGGQRFGEMEVWALEAYGAAYTLQELLTYKSDDVTGRHKVYDALVRGETVPEPGLPESFNVLIKELQALGLRVDLFKTDKEDVGVI